MERLPAGQPSENIPDDSLDDYTNALAAIRSNLQVERLTLPQARWQAIKTTIRAIRKHPNQTETIVVDFAHFGHTFIGIPLIERFAERYASKLLIN